MKTPSIFRAMAVGTISLALATVQADEIDQDQAAQLVAAGRIQPLEQLLARHPVLSAGRLLDAELEEEHGRLVYEFEILGPDGVVREVELDARSGELLEMEVED